MMKQYPLMCHNGSVYLDAVISIASGHGKIQLKFDTQDIHIELEEDYPFFALISLRRILEPQGIRILCKGSRLDVYPSSFMATSFKAYKLEMGKPGAREDLCFIFDPTDDLSMIATVDEQWEYWLRWRGDFFRTQEY
ncbi:hypothetical protein [Chitinophaga pinensis]|uniref:Uncharacterized protein n=1 Tax=Chitinophaga pinensis (strain ATCC 43595 / DSM 2588 / LMG 13176 / NBRC 15968 / NCIMB 11800 / UQM 2034) TaxID=485918 RepID=A0A979GRB5_CHIPD|nr:hypothetical protein [Chitinophaga pinensis]ACU62212.1 hypothetical protein Cpin_4777 [Chitinophaga pinensis DSM 2588]